MSPKVLILVLVALVYSAKVAYAEERILAENGRVVVDPNSAHKTFSFQGEWIYVPSQLLSPLEALAFLTDSEQAWTLVMPGTRFKESAPDLHSNDRAYGTYLMRVSGLPEGRMAFYGQKIYSSSHIYFFSERNAAEATVIANLGLNPNQIETSIPIQEIAPFHTFDSDGSSEQILMIHAANFHHGWGGLWVPPIIGSELIVANSIEKDVQREFLVLGIVLFVAIYSFALFLRRPEDKANLLLAACALSYVIRTFVISQWSANLFGDHVRTFEWTFKIVYIWFTAGIVMFLGFIYYCFPKQLPIKLYWGIVASQVPLYLIILALPVYTYYEMVKPLLDFSALALNATVLVILLRALIAREEGAGISLTGFLVSMASAINDLFWTMGLPYLFVPAIGYGFAFFFLCNTQIIAKRFALAFRKAELLSRNLQIEVDRQTREIKSILTYIEQGIFTIKGSEQSIGPDFSKHLAEIIETDDLTEHSISELLLEPANISSDQRSQIQSAIDAAIDEDSLTFEVNKNLLAREIVFRAKSGKEKILSIDWNPVLSKDDLVEKILVSVRDITSLRQLELQNKEREANMQLLIELIQIPEDRFQRFIKQTYEYLSDNIELIRATEEFRPEVIKRLFINMHTIKGAARTYLLKSLSASSHEIEQNYFNMQKTGEWNQKVLMEDIEQIKNILECYRELGEEKLGWQLSQRIVKIPVQIIEQIAENLVKLEAYQMEERQRLLLSKAKHTLYEHSFIPLSKVLEESFTGIESMARDLGKMHPEIKIDSATVIIKDSGVNLLHSLLVHLIRNSMDHGIETPEVRAGFGKEATGYIFVTSRVTNDFHLEIEYRDDGAGLDLPKIKLRAEEAGLLPAQSELSEQVIAELIFESGLTTKDQVSDVSGRGVGMDAVRRYTMDQGGSVEIRLLPPSKNSQNRPFKVVITMPDNCWFEAELLNLKQAS